MSAFVKEVINSHFLKKQKRTKLDAAEETIKLNCFQAVADGSKLTEPLPSQGCDFYLGKQSCHLFINCLLQILPLESTV